MQTAVRGAARVVLGAARFAFAGRAKGPVATWVGTVWAEIDFTSPEAVQVPSLMVQRFSLIWRRGGGYKVGNRD
jgi:hypothetical protein